MEERHLGFGGLCVLLASLCYSITFGWNYYPYYFDITNWIIRSVLILNVFLGLFIFCTDISEAGQKITKLLMYVPFGVYQILYFEYMWFMMVLFGLILQYQFHPDALFANLPEYICSVSATVLIFALKLNRLKTLLQLIGRKKIDILPKYLTVISVVIAATATFFVVHENTYNSGFASNQTICISFYALAMIICNAMLYLFTKNRYFRRHKQYIVLMVMIAAFAFTVSAIQTICMTATGVEKALVKLHEYSYDAGTALANNRELITLWLIEGIGLLAAIVHLRKTSKISIAR